MKRISVAVMLFISLVFCLSACSLYANIPNGYFGKEEHFDKDGFQDYTDYCKFFYKDAQPFENDSKYHKVEKTDVNVIKEYFDYFRQLMKDIGRATEYDFDDNCISNGDYVLINTKEGISEGNAVYGKFDNFTVYFFDADSCVLYYIHSNI